MIQTNRRTSRNLSLSWWTQFLWSWYGACNNWTKN